MTWLDVINWVQGTGLKMALCFAAGAAAAAAYYRPKVRELSAEIERDEERLDSRPLPNRSTDPNPEPRG